MTRAGPYGQSFAAKFLKEGKYEQALAAADEQLEMDPDDPDAYLERAQILAALERYEAVVEDIARCLEKNGEGTADEDVIDDTLLSALVDWGKTLNDAERAVALLGRYSEIYPGGKKGEAVAEWVRYFRGESKILIKER
jgi:tetratricopeptide (TPR) repeat protein